MGKTWILKEFGKRYYQNIAYFNFDEHGELKQFFHTTKDINRILQNLMMASGQVIKPLETYKIYRSAAPGLPIAAYDDLSAFKLYLVDVGLLRRMALLAPSAFAEGNRLFTEFKGALSENYVLQALGGQFEAPPCYWAVDNPRYEVDFLIQRENDMIPIEVKSEDNPESRSLKKFKEKYGEKIPLRVRFSLSNLKLDDDMLNIPLFMADHADRLIGLALKR